MRPGKMQVQSSQNLCSKDAPRENAGAEHRNIKTEMVVLGTDIPVLRTFVVLMVLIATKISRRCRLKTKHLTITNYQSTFYKLKLL